MACSLIAGPARHMRTRRLTYFALLLITFVLIAQNSCSPSSSVDETIPTPSPPVTEQDRVNQILDRYEQAIGTKEAIDKLTTYKLKGSFDLAGMRGTLEGWRKEPHKTLSMIHFPRLGTLKKGFDGETHWVQTAQGTFTDSNTRELAKLERDSEVYSAGKIRTQFETMKLQLRARLNGRDMHVIEGKPVKGPAERLFFDAENGLLVRWDMARREEGRTLFVKTHLEDYREIEGVKFPFRIRFAFESFTFVVQVDELQYNIPVDDAIFKRP